MNESLRKMGASLREWWKKATTEDRTCMRCGCCSNLCKLAGLNDGSTESKKDQNPKGK